MKATAIMLAHQAKAMVQSDHNKRHVRMSTALIEEKMTMKKTTQWILMTLIFLYLFTFGNAVADERILYQKMGDVRFFQENGKIGLMDMQENVLYPTELNLAVPFLDHGLCLVRKDNQVAMMDKTGNIVIPFTEAFTIITASVQDERKLDKWRIARGEAKTHTISESVYIDHEEENGAYYSQYFLADGTPITSGTWKSTYPFINGSAFVQDVEDELWYLIDAKGNKITNMGVYWPEPDVEAGGGKGRYDDKTYVIDARGVTREIYVKEASKSPQEALYKEDVLEAFFDENGQQIDKPWKRIAIYEGRQMAQGEVWGFVDEQWDMILETDFTELRFFEDKYLAPPSLAVGIACIKGEEKWRLIDAEFQTLSSNAWERLAYIGQDRFLGQNMKKQKWESSILNEQGEVIFTFPLGYLVRAFVDEGYILYETNVENQKGDWGFYDYEGNETCRIKKSRYPLMPGEIPDVYPKLKDGVMVVFENNGKQNVIVHAATGAIYRDNHSWDHINDFAYGRSFARSGTDWFLVDNIGSTVVAARFTGVLSFEEYGEIALARGTYVDNGRRVYVDTQGRVVAGTPDPD